MPAKFDQTNPMYEKIMATHDAGIVDQMRKRVIELDGGHVIRDQVRGVYGYTG